jgi:IclR family transcriptional regulator, acetate operon repressor
VAGVQSIERAFTVLRAVATGPAGISEVARRVDLPTSTVARLLGTLESIGAVTRVGDGVTYQVGPTVAELATATDGSAGVSGASRPFLVELVHRVGETAGLSVPDGNEVLYLDHVDAAMQVQIRDWSGDRLPLHVVSSGLVMLAHRPAADIEDYLGQPLATYTEHTVIDPEALRRRLEAVRRQGFVWTAEEFDLGLTSVAAPVFSPSGAVVGALHCHGPSFRFPPRDAEERIGALVREVSDRLTARLT